MIKVVLLIPTLDRSGAEKQLTLLATRLPRDEFQVHVVALTRGGPFAEILREHGIPLSVLNKRWKCDPIALFRLRQTIGQLQPDILHSWLFAANAYGRFVAGQQPGPRVVVSERCVDVWKSGWQLWLDRRQIARTDRLIANSRSVADFYARQGFPRDRIAVIPNGVEIPSVSSASAARREAVRTQLGISPNARVVAFVGRLAPQKRLEDLIWATELLRQLDERTHFVIIGDGPDRERLARFTRQIGLESFVSFAGQRDDVDRLLPDVDVFWLASDFEGQSNSLMEAMAAGLPVVASDIPPNRELVEDGVTGTLVKVGDRAAFAEAAHRLLQDERSAQRMGAAARERMRSEFSIDRMVERHAALYREVALHNVENDEQMARRA